MTLPILLAPLIPLAPLIVLAILATLIVLIGLIRRARGVGLRAAGFALLLIVLAGPRWQVQTTSPLTDIALIVRDRSPSMQIDHRAALETVAFHHLVHTLPPATRLRVVTVTGNHNNGTRLFAALRGALSSIPPNRLAGIVTITDGETTDHPTPIPPGVPLSALITARHNETDRALDLIAAPSYGLVGHHVPLRFMVRDHGVQDRGTSVPVTVSVDGRVVKTIMAQADLPVTTRLAIAHAGTAVVAVAAQPLPGEVSRANNDAVFDLAGVRRRLTVLLIAGNPNPGLRTWRLLLKADPAVRLVNFTILRLPDEAMAAPVRDMALIPFPVDQLFSRDLGKFDLIILDQFSDNGLLLPPYLANITNHVRAGGALLIEAGPEFERGDSLAHSPLAPILPARPSGGTITGRFTPALTIKGKRDPVTAPLAAIRRGPWYRYENVVKTRGVSVLQAPATGTTPAAPLLILSHAGRGRVALLLSDQFWLWARGALAHDPTMAGPAQPLLRRTVHWLLGQPSLASHQLHAHIARGRLTVERSTLSASSAGSATVTNPAGATTSIALHRIAPGRYAGSMPAPQAGVWKVTVEQGAAKHITAYAGAADHDPAEQADLAATDGIFAPIAARTGGHIVWLGRNPKPGWSGLLRRRHAAIVTGARTIRVPAIPVAILAMALLAGAWWRERGRVARLNV